MEDLLDHLESSLCPDADKDALKHVRAVKLMLVNRISCQGTKAVYDFLSNNKKIIRSKSALNGAIIFECKRVTITRQGNTLSVKKGTDKLGTLNPRAIEYEDILNILDSVQANRIR